ncbi:MAG: 6-bladed beta-propeller [Bacteroidales bacterium]|nr:6-bladed beta-propeller [Bacteroidales bacterium]
MKRILIVFFCFVIPGIIIGQEVFEHNIEVDPGKVINEACLSDLFESYRFVPLETRQDALIASLVKSVINDKTIYIQSRVGIKSRILVFSLETGKFIASVDRNGRGPGEYLIIYDFAVNSQGSIFVLAGKKIIKYKKSGEFDEEYKLKVSADMFICTSDGGFILSPPNYKHEIVILDKQLNINKCLFPHELYRIGYHDILQSVNKTVYYNRKNHGSYYYFLDSDAKPFIQIKFKGYKPNSKILEKVIAES